MGTCIESVATATRGIFSPFFGALSLTDQAASACLRRGGRDADELDLLVNAGLYKDRNIAEPALASIIQEDLGANPGHPPRRDHHGTFSFDVLNGGCGVMTAAQIVDGFVGPGTASLGLVVAADADPSPTSSEGFGFSSVGGALLLAHVDGTRGFSRFEFRTFPEDAELFESAIRYAPNAGLLRRGLNVLTMREAPAYGPRCVEHAVEVARGFLARQGLRASDVDLLVASQHPRAFGELVASQLGIARDAVPKLRAERASAHTAGPLAALESAIHAGRFARARHVLFVTAGAGITIGVAHYVGRDASR